MKKEKRKKQDIFIPRELRACVFHQREIYFPELSGDCITQILLRFY